MGMELGGDGGVDETEKPCRDRVITQGVCWCSPSSDQQIEKRFLK